MDRASIMVRWLGRQPYAPMLELQRRLQAGRREAGGHDWLLLLEHEPVFTLGRQHGTPKWRDADRAKAAGVPIVQAERGGDITYHGPGQLVAYLVMDLRQAGLGAGDLVHALEEAAIRTVARSGIEAGRDARNRGAWVNGRKIAQVGISVRGGVSMHGIALNVAPDAGYFAMIEACGLPDVEVTSIEDEAGIKLAVETAGTAFATELGLVLDRELVMNAPGIEIALPGYPSKA